MKKTVKELLDTSQFNFYINLGETDFFVDKPKDKNVVNREINQKLTQNFLSNVNLYEDKIKEYQNKTNKYFQKYAALEERRKAYQKKLDDVGLKSKRDKNGDLILTQELKNEIYSELEEIKKEEESLEKEAEFLRENGKRFVSSDAFTTSMNLDSIKEALIENSKYINENELNLYYGLLAKKYLTWITDAENGKHKGYDEICYGNGEIIVVNGNKITSNMPDFSVEDLKHRLVETALIANSNLQESKINKNKPLIISGNYYGRGGNQAVVRERFSSNDLIDFCKSEVLLSSINKEKLDEYINSGLFKKWDIVKFIDKGLLSADIAIELMLKGIFTKEEVFTKIIKENVKTAVMSDKISFSAKLLLYSSENIDIKTFEDAAKQHIENNEQVPREYFYKVSKYYTGNINKVSQLLTHDILDFTKSMEFLDALVEQGEISTVDKDYLTEIMNDFKTNELLNNTKNAMREKGNREITNKQVHSHGVSIDPKIRKQYLESIGDVKEILIKGQASQDSEQVEEQFLIKDDSESATKKNSLDGYQLIIIPDKKIAVLEKFYEVTRDKDGNVMYKKDENGNSIAAIENATYVMPIGMAKDFAERKNKQQLRKSPYVIPVSHTMNWVTNIEQAMKTVAGRAHLKVDFEKENTEKWAELVVENYKKLKEKRDRNIDELI